MSDRTLSGVFIRWQAPDGKWRNKDVTDLPWSDVVAWLDGREADRAYVLDLARIFHKVIREIGETLCISKEPQP